MRRQYPTSKKPPNPERTSRVTRKSVKHSEVPQIQDPANRPPPPAIQAPPYIPGGSLGAGEPKGVQGLHVPSLEELEQELFGSGSLVNALRQFEPHLDIRGNWERGKAYAEAQAAYNYNEHRGNVPVLRAIATNARELTTTNLRGVVTGAQYFVNDGKGGSLEQHVMSTGTSYTAYILMTKYADEASGDKGGGEESRGDPDAAAESYFNEQKMKHRDEQGFYWVVPLNETAVKQMSSPATSDWDRRYWTRIYTLIEAYAGERRDERSERERAGPGLSGWGLLIALGIAAAVVAGVWVFA